MLKSLRLKHYSYLLLALLLLVFSMVNIVTNLFTANASDAAVTITSPTANQEVNQSTRQITGLAPALKEVVVFDGTERIGTTTASAGGTWSIEWEDPTPGEHQLRATVTDGVVYDPDVFSQNSIKAKTLNTGQVTQNYAAGLSGSTGIVFDDGLQKSFVINYYAGTVSQIDMASKEIEETIVYNSGTERSGLGEARYYSLCAANEIIRSVCAYTFDQQSHKLYLLDNTKLYVINLQSRVVESTIEVGETDDNEYAPIDLQYKLYLDPQNDFVYIYHARHVGVPTLNTVKRVNLQAQALEDGWTKQNSNAAVSTAAGDVFFADNAALFVALASSETPEEVSIAGGLCANGIDQLALAKDENYLYAACRNESDSKKIVVISTNDGQIVSTLDREGNFLQEGNLTSEKLLVATASDNSIQVLDTTTNSFVSNIQSIAGVMQKRSMVIDGTNEKVYFATLDADSSQNHLYTVDLNNSGILADFTNPTTDYSGVRSATLTTLSSYAFVPVEANESVHSLSLSNGTHGLIESGMGSPVMSVYSESTQRLFTIPGAGVLGLGNRIAVASTDDASFQEKVTLPGSYTIVGAELNESGSTLYALGAELNDQSSLQVTKVFAIDTTTLQVTQIYNTVSQYTYNETGEGFSRIAIKGTKLAFTDSRTLYVVDLENDTSVTSALDSMDGSYGSLTGSLGILSRVAFSNDGSKVAVIIDARHVSVRDLDSLTEQFQITKAANYYISGVFFDQNNDILVTSGAEVSTGGSIHLGRYNNSTGSLIKTIALPNPPGLGLWVCLPTVNTLSSSQELFTTTAMCVNFIGAPDPSISWYNYVVDLETDTATHTKEHGDNAAINGIPIITDVELLSVTQTVVVRADAVTITSPSEGEQVAVGIRKIIGTAPSNASIRLKIDGRSIGTVQADQYGAWNLDHEFTTRKAYQIKAEYTKPTKQLQYLPFMSLDISQYPTVTYTGKISIFNTQNNKTEREFTLPDDYIPLVLEVSNDQSKLYVVGVKILNVDSQSGSADTSDMKIFAINPANEQVISSADLEGTSSDDIGLFAFGLAVLSPNQEHIAIGSAQSLKLFSIDGVSEKTIPFTESPIRDGEYLKRVISDEDAQNVAIASNKQVTTINTETDEVQTATLPEDTYVSSIVYSASQQKLLGALAADEGYGAMVSGTSLNGEGVSWVVELLDFKPLPDAVISKDGERLLLFGTKEDGTVGTIDIKISDGTYASRFAQPSSSSITSYIEAISNAASSAAFPFKLAPDLTGSKLYSPSYSVMPALLFMPFEEVSAQVVPDWGGESAYSFYSNVSDKVALEQSGTTLKETRNFTVVNQPQPPDPPHPPDTDPDPGPDPFTPPSPSKVAPTTKAAVASKKQLISSAEKKALRSAPFANFFAGTKKFFSGIPRPLMKILPYILYLGILALVGYYLYQTQEQLRREDRMRKILTKQKVLTEEKRNFLDLTSHYLRTPLTYIRSGAEISERKGQSRQLATDLSQAVNHLSLFIESLIEEAGAERNAIVVDEARIKSPLLSRNFLFPALGLTVSVALFYIIASGIAGIRFENSIYLTHIILTALILRLLYGMIKNHGLVIAEAAQVKETLEAEQALDHSRSKLLADAGEQLQVRVEHITGLSDQLTDDETSKKIINQGATRLQELARTFSLVSHLESKAIGGEAESIAVRDLAADIIKPFTATLQQKQIKLSVEGFDSGVSLTTNKAFAQLTLKSLIQNAIDASVEGSNITIKCLHSSGRVAFQVIDHGEGIPKEKLSQLFKPFMRVGPVTTFNREGIGLSLFIDRLIMHALGGEVEIMSKLKEGTVATLLFKQKPAM